MKIYNSTHSFNNSPKYNSDSDLLTELCLIKNEEFGFFIGFKFENPSYLSLERHFDLPWWGLDNRYRFELTILNDDKQGAEVSASLCSYVLNDDKFYYADIISNEKSMYYDTKPAPVYIGGKVSSDFKDKRLTLEFRLYKGKGYNKEELVCSKEFGIDILDFELSKDDDSFYLDLWLQPCSLARTYSMSYYSDEHFDLIEKYLKAMSDLGQDVIDLIVSDFPWAGQACFKIGENASRLYEYNIVKIGKKAGNFNFDFANLDRFVELCFKYGIKKEINLFGICGNWHGSDFKSPLSDYLDPIRVSYYDEDERCYDFIRDKSDLHTYLKALFTHMEEKGYMPITKIIGDEPSDNDRFNSFHDFLSTCYDKTLSFKYAMHSSSFLDNYKGSYESFSLNSAYIGDYVKDGELSGILKEHSHEMTWYPCCFPKKLNTFVGSPLIESRYLGLYTYLWQFKGMLRWAYALYTEKPFENICYKPETWDAGDMFFVYPGKNMQICHSIREKNMLFSIQDFNIFKKLEKRGVSVLPKLRESLGIKILAKNENKELILDEYKDYTYYKEIRDMLIRGAYEN